MDEMKDPAERFVWFGFLLLAGDSAYEGKICLTDDMGYSDEQLGAMLRCDATLIRKAKKKMLKYNKIEVLKNNIIQIVNWSKYQSEYQRQRPYRSPDGQKLLRKVTAKGDDTKLRKEGDRDRDKNKIRKEGEKPKKIHMSSSYKNNIISKWNELAQKHNLAAIMEIKSGSLREKNLRARSADENFNFELLVDMINNSPFLLGKTKNPFFVFFDWIIKPTNYQKIIEGNYLDRQSYQKFSGIIEGIKDLKKQHEEGRKNES